MTNSTSEREQRLTKPYKEHLRETLRTTEDYVGYLNACHDEGPETFALAVRDVTEFVATSMRDLCVEKVKAMRDDWQTEAEARRDPENPYDYRGSYGLATGSVDACNDIITALESLTLDQVEQEKQ